MSALSPQSPPGFVCVRRFIDVSVRSQQRPEIELRLVEAGSVSLLMGGRVQHLPARRLAVYWAGMPHQVLSREAAEGWMLRLPPGWVIERGLPAAFIKGLLEGRVFFEPDGDHFDCDLFLLQLWSADSLKRNPLVRRSVALEIEARLLRLAATLPAELPPLAWNVAPGRKRSSKAGQLACFVGQHYLEPLSATQIGRAVGLHRNYAMNLFRREFGTSLFEYLTQFRLAHAMRLMLTLQLALPEIARQSGFGSLKQLSANFRRAFKETPSKFMRGHRHRLVTA